MTRRRLRDPGPIAQLRAARAHRDQEHQDGFTIIETVVAMAVFAVTLIPTTGIFFGGMQAASVSNIRSDAVGVAASMLAQVRSLPYNLVGFYSGQANYVSVCPATVTPCAGQATVVLGTGLGPAGAFTPVTPSPTIGATSYSVTTYITWANANVPSGTCSAGSTLCVQAYKEATTVVSWSGLSRMAGSITETTLVYPGGQGQYTAAGGGGSGGNSCPGSPASPTGLSAVPYPNPQNLTPDPGEYEANVSWASLPLASQPCYFVILDATSNADLPATCASASGPSAEASTRQPGSEVLYTVTGLSPGVQYYFAVIAYNSDGSQCAMSSTSPAVTATTDTAPAPPTCTVTGLTVTAVPSQSAAKTYESSGGAMTDNLNLVASTTGSGCANLTVQGHLVNSATQDPGSPYTLASGTGGQFTYTVPSQNVSWTTGQHVFTVYLGGTVTTDSQSIEVCAHAGNGQKTSTPNVCP
ncbi:MAG TPA: fibronectin type III domain-containing protein [Acidimicrobiales bacterium]|nr:fibronectin type III domain-containing protein [Acidimicrobiales bacterium]